jgi:hypothetical protein
MSPPPADPALATACRRVIEGALSVVPGESVVLLVDREHEDVGDGLASAVHDRAARSTTIVLEDLGPRGWNGVPAPVREALESAQASVLLIDIVRHPELLLRRDIIDMAKALGLRHAHLIGLSRRALLAGMTVDPARVAEVTRTVRGKMLPSSKLAVRSPGGSALEVDLDPRYRWKLHTGAIRSGHWENLPSGLLLTHTSNVRGRFVADACIMGRFAGHEGLLTTRPLRFEIENGVCKDVKCVDFALAQEVRRHLSSEAYLDRVGAVILGTNVGLSQPLGELLHDQCLPGLHLVFGYTHREETGAPFCSRGILSATGAYADVDLDGAPLVRRGRYLSF